MVFKPNYNQQRAERDRLKQAKKDAKLREREETRRKVAQDANAAEGAVREMSPAADAEDPHGS